MRSARIAWFLNSPLMEISATDVGKIIAYLNDAAKLYDALPMQAMRSRAFMIKKLTTKLKTRLDQHKKNG